MRPRSGPGQERTCAQSQRPHGEDTESGPPTSRDQDDRSGPDDAGVGQPARDRQPAEPADEERAGDGVAPPATHGQSAVDGSGEHEVDPRHRRHDRAPEAAGPVDRDEDRGHARPTTPYAAGELSWSRSVALSLVRNVAWTNGKP